MIQAIEILINNVGNCKKIIINNRNYELLCNDKVYKINETKVNELLDIIHDWKSMYYKEVIDAEEFIITIFGKDYKSKISGKGEYPKNYGLLINWIEGIINE